MHKTLVIASREYQASVRSKAFIVSLVIMPVLMSGSVLMQMLFKDAGGKAQRFFALIDRTPEQTLRKAIAKRAQEKPGWTIEYQEAGTQDTEAIKRQRLQLSQRVKKGELMGFLEIGAGVYPTRKVPFPPNDKEDKWVIRYQSNNPTTDDFGYWVKGMVKEVVIARRCALKKYDETTVKQIAKAIPLKSKSLSQETAQGQIEDAPDLSRLAAFFVPFGLTMLMFMVLMIGATPLMQGIVEEKMQRIAEVLLGSVRPFELMMGKLLGMVGVSLTLVGIYLGGGYWALDHMGYADYLPLDIVAWFLVFQILSLLMYGSLFIAVGAACTDTKETQMMLMPVMLLACLPFFVLGNVLHNPNSGFVEGMSFIPFATPMLMIARQAIPPGVPAWQPLVGAAGVLVTSLLCVYAAGRIFRVGILMQGKGAKFGDLFRWVFRG
jgi:ABC-2 type transport system permease protein